MQPMHSEASKPLGTSRKRWLSLAAALGIVALIWLIALPLLARQPEVQAHIERNKQAGIDPSVRFYSELPEMPAYLERIDSAHRRHGDAFWNRSPASMAD